MTCQGLKIRARRTPVKNTCCKKNGIVRRPDIKRPDIGKEQEGDKEFEPAPDDIGGRRTEFCPLQRTKGVRKGRPLTPLTKCGMPLVRNAAAMK